MKENIYIFKTAKSGKMSKISKINKKNTFGDGMERGEEDMNI